MATESLDYQLVGLSMSKIKRLVVSCFMGGVARGRMPKPVMCWGAPGEGKTFTIFAAAREIARRLDIEEVKVIDNPTSCLEPCDVTGVPMPVKVANGDEKFTRYLALEWAWLASKEYEVYRRLTEPDFIAPPMLLLFDDLPAAHFQTQSAFFKGVHEGKWGSLNQRINVMVVAAGNRVEDNAAANDMPTPLANRFRHCYANPTTDDWLKWAASDEGGIHPFVIGFIRTCKDDLREFNDDVATRAEKAFASPRTWHDISELLWEGEIGATDELFAPMTMGIVGRGSATKFLGFMRNTTAVVSPEEIVKNPKKARVPTARNLDALHATIASLELHVKQNPKHWKAAVIYATRTEMLSDVGILLAQTVAEVANSLPAKERAAAFGSDAMAALHDRYEDLIDSLDI